MVERRANPDDRRLYSLHLTKEGGELLERIGKVAREHQDALLTALTREERSELTTLLLRIADQQGLVRGVHPGYQRLGSPKRSESQ
jgi:DNA-binding MarR family transcriptional regulator